MVTYRCDGTVSTNSDRSGHQRRTGEVGPFSVNFSDRSVWELKKRTLLPLHLYRSLQSLLCFNYVPSCPWHTVENLEPSNVMRPTRVRLHFIKRGHSILLAREETKSSYMIWDFFDSFCEVQIFTLTFINRFRFL